MPYFEEGSRACLRCGCVITDPNRQVHIDFHERIDPWPVEPEPETEPVQPEEPAA